MTATLAELVAERKRRALQAVYSVPMSDDQFLTILGAIDALAAIVRTQTIGEQGRAAARPRLPVWTVLYNINHEPMGVYWIGTGWEFFDTEELARSRYEELIAEGHTPCMRPYYPTDGEHLGAVHEEQYAYAKSYKQKRGEPWK